MSETFREVIDAAERTVAGEASLDQDYFERLLSDPRQFQSGGDEERAYLAVLLDSIGLHDESVRVLRDGPGTGSVGVNATLRNIEGMLAAIHGQYGHARDILKQALSATADSSSLRIKILANLAAVSLRAGRVEEAEAWAEAADADGASGSPAADVLIASVRAGIASARGDMPGLRLAASSLGDASRSWAADLGDQDTQALILVANMANTEIMMARAEGSPTRLERAVAVLEVAASRLAAELGAKHPQSLAAVASLALAELDIARGFGSTQKIEQAIATLETVRQRVSAALGNTSPEALLLAESLASAQLGLSVAQDSIPNPEPAEPRPQLEREHSATAPRHSGRELPEQLAPGYPRPTRESDGHATSKPSYPTSVIMLLKKARPIIGGSVIAALTGLAAFASLYELARPETIFFGVLLLAAMVIIIFRIYAKKFFLRKVHMTIGMVVAASVITVGTGAGAGYLVRQASTARPVGVGAVSGSIISPRDGSDIPQSIYLDLAGTARNVQAGYRLWLFLYVASVTKYYASAPGSITLTGTRWTGTIYVGESNQPGEQFTLWLVDFGPESLQVLKTETPHQSDGFSTLKLAPDTTILSSVTFTIGSANQQGPTSSASPAPVLIPLSAACKWAYPGQASGKISGRGYSIVCLGANGQVLGGFSGSHSLNAWCVDPRYTDSKYVPDPALVKGIWVCTA